MAGLVGKWQLEKTENFDEYMQTLGGHFSLTFLEMNPSDTSAKCDVI